MLTTFPNTKDPTFGTESLLIKSIAFYLPGLVLLFCAGFAILIALLDYQTIAGWLDSMSADGSADAFSEHSFFLIKKIGLVCSVSGVLICSFALVFRGKISRIITAYYISFRIGLKNEFLALRAGHKSTPAADYMILGLILAAGLLVRLQFLKLPIRYDEAYSYLNYVSRPFLITLSLYDAPNNHIFYNLCAKLAVVLFGSGEWVLRLPALFAGIVLIPGVYFLGRVVFVSRSTAILAASLVAGSAYLIEYAVNARGYSFICLFTILLLVATQKIINGVSKSVWWFVFIVAAVLGMATVPTMIYSLTMVAAWLLISSAQSGKKIFWANLKGILLAALVVLFLTLIWYAPALITGGYKTFMQTGFAERNLAHWYTKMEKLLAEFVSFSNGLLPGWAVGMSVLAVLIGILRKPLLACSIFFLPVVFFIQNVAPYTRVLLFLTMIYLVFAGAGLASILERIGGLIKMLKINAVTAILAFGITGFHTVGWLSTDRIPNLDRTMRFPEAEAAAVFLKGKISGSTPVLTNVPLDNPLIFYGLQIGMERMSFLSDGMVKEAYDSLWVLENNHIGRCKLQYLIEANGLKRIYLKPPQFVKQFNNVNIYLFLE